MAAQPDLTEAAVQLRQPVARHRPPIDQHPVLPEVAMHPVLVLGSCHRLVADPPVAALDPTPLLTALAATWVRGLARINAPEEMRIDLATLRADRAMFLIGLGRSIVLVLVIAVASRIGLRAATAPTLATELVPETGPT